MKGGVGMYDPWRTWIEALAVTVLSLFAYLLTVFLLLEGGPH